MNSNCSNCAPSPIAEEPSALTAAPLPQPTPWTPLRKAACLLLALTLHRLSRGSIVHAHRQPEDHDR